MRWLELARDLLDGIVKWYGAWEPTFKQEREERKAKKQKDQTNDESRSISDDDSE